MFIHLETDARNVIKIILILRNENYMFHKKYDLGSYYFNSTWFTM